MDVASLSLIIVSLQLTICMVCFADEKITKDTEVGEKEYCLAEVFHPRCQQNEVILMKSATYGRMHIGRCITADEVAAQRSLAAGDDPRILGCSADVLPVLDHKCSGKSECELRVIDIAAENVKPCFPILNVFLEVTYDCLNIADDSRSCTVAASSSDPIHLTVNSLTSERSCGTASQPWIVESPLGQKIKIAIFDFSHTTSGGRQEWSEPSCPRWRGIVVDKIGKRNASLCVEEDHRQTDAYESTGNVVEIKWSRSDAKKETTHRNFIIRVQAVGCSDIVPPEDTWLKRKEDAIVIGCYSSRHTWHLRCKEGNWIGVLGNCSQDNLVHQSKEEDEIEDTTNKQILAIVAISAFTLAICLTVMCIGTVCLQRYKTQSHRKPEYRTLDFPVSSVGGQTHSEQRLPSSSGGVGTADSTRNDFRGFNTTLQQVPTYSVYVGDSHLNDPDVVQSQ